MSATAAAAATSDYPVGQRSRELFDEHRHQILVRTDRLFAILMVVQWVAAIIMALVISPRTWEGTTSRLHIHVWTAFLLGGLLSAFPIFLVWRSPGARLTRYVIACAQMLWSALLIHLTGGRIETHFHVFGSLAFLAFYRDWKVLIPATVVVGLDHLLRGIYWPQSVYGVVFATPWRSLEHAAWVVFEDIFLIQSCRRSIQEMWDIARRRAQLERTNEIAEAANEAVKQSEERTSKIIETALDAVVTIDAAGVITGWNTQAETIFGWSRDEAVGKVLASTVIPPAYRDAHRKGLRHFLDTGVGPVLNKRIEITALHRDGREFPIELSITPIAVGRTFSFSAFVRDITERKRAEEGLRESAAALAFSNESLRSVNEELRRRNVELDEFTSIASHDLQEPLRKITAFGELLPKDLGEVMPETAQKDLGFIIDAAHRMRVLVQDLLALSRTGRVVMTREHVSLESCADRGLLAVDVEIERTGAEITRDELPDVLGDPTLLAQLYQNLIGNALKFAEPSRRPEIHLTCEREDDQWIFGVRDNGIGIKAEYQQQIFAPFKRLHGRNEYEGTGIGLAICRKAVERHGGRIWVESEPSKGAHFKFSLNTDSESLACSRERENRPSSSSPRMIPAIRS